MPTFKINNRQVTQEEWNQSKEDGVYQSFYDNGQLQYEGTYVKGEDHILTRSFYDNGKRKYEATYVNGKIHGLVRGWYEDGQLRLEYLCVHGERRDIDMPKLEQVVHYGKQLI